MSQEAVYLNRHNNRLVSMWVLSGEINNSHSEELLTTYLNFGRYTPTLEDHAEQLPLWLVGSSRKVELDGQMAALCVFDPRALILKSASGTPVLFLDICFKGGHEDCIDMMHAVYSRKFSWKREGEEDLSLSEHYKQILTVGRFGRGLLDRGLDVTQLIYRFRMKKGSKPGNETYPPETNIREDGFTAVSRFVTVLYRPQDYMEVSMYLSCFVNMTALATIEKCREGIFRILKELDPKSSNGSRRQDDLVRMSKSLEELLREFLLNVEEPRFIGIMLPSLRVEDFHEAVSAKSQIDEKRASLSMLFGKVEELITTRKIQEDQKRGEQETLRRTIIASSAGFISLLFLPPSLILAFFGAKTVEVGEPASLWDFNSYGLLYLGAFGTIAGVFGLAFFASAIGIRRLESRHRSLHSSE